MEEAALDRAVDLPVAAALAHPFVAVVAVAVPLSTTRASPCSSTRT